MRFNRLRYNKNTIRNIDDVMDALLDNGIFPIFNRAEKHQGTNDKLVIVPVSGGKDSQACLKIATKKHGAENIVCLFCDTGIEHDMTYDHVEKITQDYCTVTLFSGTVLDESIRYKRFAGGGSRFCTDQLKIRPSKIFYHLMSVLFKNIVVYYGMRSGESNERAKRYNGKISDEYYTPYEIMPSKYPSYLGNNGVMFRLPILEWTTEQVFELLDGEENPLYKLGFDRVGCFPCMAGGDAWKLKAFEFDDIGKKHFELFSNVSVIIEKPIFTSKKFKDKNPHDFVIKRKGDIEPPCESYSGCQICSI